MWKLFKKFLYLIFFLAALALIFDFKIMDQSARTWAGHLWNQPQVQKVYEGILERTRAVFNKEINVEDAFKSESPKPGTSRDE